MLCTVSGEFRTPNGQVHPGAVVKFRRSAGVHSYADTGGPVTVVPNEVAMTTDVDGLGSVSLYPGRYQVELLGSNGGAYRFVVNVPTQNTLLFTELLSPAADYGDGGQLDAIAGYAADAHTAQVAAETAAAYVLGQNALMTAAAAAAVSVPIVAAQVATDAATASSAATTATTKASQADASATNANTSKVAAAASAVSASGSAGVATTQANNAAASAAQAAASLLAADVTKAGNQTFTGTNTFNGAVNLNGAVAIADKPNTRAALGLGASIEALNALTPAADRLPYFTAANGAGLAALASWARINLLAATSGDNAATLMGFTMNNGATGYARLPGGLIVQWGTATQNASLYVSIPMPLAFPNALLSITGNHIGTGGAMCVEDATSRTRFGTSFYIFNNAGSRSAGWPMSWLAVGY